LNSAFPKKLLFALKSYFIIYELIRLLLIGMVANVLLFRTVGSLKISPQMLQ
jgi:hypothetical protein